ncbi:MAG: hypothetical protein V2A64_03860 [Candidatus Omnitrophota bacterium]
MGVIYKLKLEIRDYILEQKRKTPALSCRNLSLLIEEDHKIKVSKSSINSIIKLANLSMPVGRRLKKRPGQPKTPQTAISAETQIKICSETDHQTEEAISQIPTLQPEQADKLTSLTTSDSETNTKLLTDSSAKFSMLTQKQDKHLPQPFASPPLIPLPVEKVEKEKSPLSPPFFKEGKRDDFEDTTLTTGAILLKAADCLIRGSNCINNLICAELKSANRDFFAKTEALLYAPLFDNFPYSNLNSYSGLWPLITQKFTPQELLTHFVSLQNSAILPSEILHVLPRLFQEVRGIKVTLSNQTTLYIDAQFRSTWSTPYTPYDFSLPSYEIRRYVNNCIQKNSPLVLFTAPQDDLIPEEFLDFILSFPPQETNGISSLTLYGSQLEELDVLKYEPNQQGYFIFGLWPWQYHQYRTINILKEFKPFYFQPLKMEFHIADIEIKLERPEINKQAILKGCALKTSANEKEKLFILSNLPAGNPEQLANAYLSRWPNLERTFQDHNRKIERYTYTGNCESCFSRENLNISQESTIDINGLFQHYLKILNSYVLWQFLPSGYEYKDFPEIQERFYNLRVTLKQQTDYLQVIFNHPKGFLFTGDLEYACQRLNEKEIKFNDGKKLWFFHQPI